MILQPSLDCEVMSLDRMSEISNLVFCERQSGRAKCSFSKPTRAAIIVDEEPSPLPGTLTSVLARDRSISFCRLRIADPFEVPSLRRREDPLTQSPYVLFDSTPLNLVPVNENVLGSVHQVGVVDGRRRSIRRHGVQLVGFSLDRVDLDP